MYVVFKPTANIEKWNGTEKNFLMYYRLNITSIRFYLSYE